MSFNHQIWNINFSGIHGWGEHQILKVDSGANKEPPNRCHVWTTVEHALWLQSWRGDKMLQYWSTVAAKLEQLRSQEAAILEPCCCQVGATEEPRGCIVWALFLPSWRNSGAKRLQSWITVAAMLELGEKLLLEQCCMLPSWSEGAGSLVTNWNGGAKLQWMLRQASALCQPSWSQVTRRCYLEPKL